MGTILFIIIAIVVLMLIPAPKRDLSKRPRRRTSRTRKVMPMFNSIKRKRAKQRLYFRKFDSF